MNWVRIALSGIVPPIVVSALALAIAWLPRSRSGPSPGPDRTRDWAAPIAIGLGAASAFVVLHGWPPFAFDVELKHGLTFLAVVGAVAGIVEARRGRVSVLTRLTVSLATPWYLLDFVREHQWAPVEGWIWTAGLGIGLFALHAGLEGLARRGTGPMLPILWMLVGSGTAGALHLTGSSSLGQMAGAWTSSLGVCAAVGFLRPSFHLARGAVAALAPLLGGVLLGGVYASELPWSSALLLVGAALGPWIVEVPRARRLRDATRWGVACVVTAVPIAIVLWLAWSGVADDPYAGY